MQYEILSIIFIIFGAGFLLTPIILYYLIDKVSKRKDLDACNSGANDLELGQSLSGRGDNGEFDLPPPIYSRERVDRSSLYSNPPPSYC
jgi:hypothetical protein